MKCHIGISIHYVNGFFKEAFLTLKDCILYGEKVALDRTRHLMEMKHCCVRCVDFSWTSGNPSKSPVLFVNSCTSEL